MPPDEFVQLGDRSTGERNAQETWTPVGVRLQCNSLMVGSGGDTYDPLCSLPEGHTGPCRSVAARDQHHITSGELNRIYAKEADRA